MKIRPTPLLLAALGLLLWGIYVLIFVDPGEEGWGILAGMVLVGLGIAALMIHFVFGFIFKTKVWRQVIVESVLILAVLFLGYKKSSYYQFTLPHNYRGYVILVYEVNGAPRLKTPLYTNKAKFKVPLNGIILTSGRAPGNFNDPAVFHDSTLGNIEYLKGSLRRYDLPLSSDQINCQGKTYNYDIWIIKDEPNWSAVEDSINRLDLKLAEVCKLIASSH